MSITLINTHSKDSDVAAYVAVLLLALCFRPAILYPLAEVAYAILLVTIAGYLLVGKRMFWSRSKTLFVVWATAFYIYITLQGVAFGTAPMAVVLREMGFMLGPAVALVLINRFTWRSAFKGFIAPVLFFLPSYLFSGLITLLTGTYETLALKWFILDMGDATYEAVWAFPYSLYLGGVNEIGPIAFHRSTGFVREPGIYQILLSITYFGIDFLEIRYKRFLKGAVLLNLFLTFSTAGWGAFAAAWLYYNIFSSRGQYKSRFKALLQRAWAILLSIPLVYYVVFAEAKASVSEKLAGSSGQERVLQSLIAFQEFSTSPLLGVGFGNPSIPGIHFVGVLAEVGIVGVTIIGAFIVFPLWPLIRRRHPILVFLVPLILTTLFAQPIFGKTIFFLIITLVVAYPVEGLPKSSTRR